MEPLLESIAKDLPLFGYGVTSQTEDLGAGITLEVLVCRHPTKPHFWVLPLGQGAFFRAFFKVGPQAEVDQAGFLQLLNEGNTHCFVARYYLLATNILAIGAWYPRP